MAITHATTKAPGQTLAAVADWNAAHAGDATPTVHDNTKHTVAYQDAATYGAHDHSAADPAQVSHADLTNVTSDQHHAKQHAITAIADHTSAATSGQMLKADANGLPVDATNTDAAVSAAVTASHAKQHAITATTDHTSTATSGRMLKADASGLPVDATNTDAAVAAAVTASHAIATVADTATIDMTLTGQQVKGDVIKQMSITSDASGLKLSADATTPGNYKLYATDSAGTKGWLTGNIPGSMYEILVDQNFSTAVTGLYLFILWGAGGGGGGTATTATDGGAGGGGAGSMAAQIITCTAGTPYAIALGAGGAGGTGAADGSAGGDTTVLAGALTAKGGSGGLRSGAVIGGAGGAGGVLGVATLRIAGDAGSPGCGVDVAGSGASGGRGGGMAGGRGGIGGAAAGATSGGYGSGGGGSGGNIANGAGGSGGQGLCVIVRLWGPVT